MHERATATGPVNFDALGEVIDGYEPDWNPDPRCRGRGEPQRPAWRRATRSSSGWRRNLRFQHEVLAEIHELTGAESKHPLTDRDLIRVKAQVALRQAAKSGLLT
jgi:hypothetical protein